MTLEGVVLGILGVMGTTIVTLLGFLISQLVKLASRVRALERRDKLSWLYIRSLIDYAYHHSDTTQYPLPLPPEGWLGDIEKE